MAQACKRQQDTGPDFLMEGSRLRYKPRFLMGYSYVNAVCCPETKALIMCVIMFSVIMFVTSVSSKMWSRL